MHNITSKQSNIVFEYLKNPTNRNEIQNKYMISSDELDSWTNIYLSSPKNRADTMKEREIIHILHIGKTGGTALNEAIKPNPISKNYLLVHRVHKIHLVDIPKGDKVIFFIRDPLDRFVSSFNSRKRKGKPRYSGRWSPTEELIFSHFSTPNELGLALADSNEQKRKLAEKAMQSIYHVKSHYWDWFKNESYLFERKDDILFVGHQESLEDDFQHLKLLCQLDPKFSLPTDNVLAHRSIYNDEKHIDSLAQEAIKQWYAKDYEFMNIVNKMLF